MSNLDSTLPHIYRLLLRTPKIAAHLPEILDLVMHSTNAERGQIELYDEQGDLRFREARKEGKEIRDRRESKISGKILAWVWENKRSVLSEDARRDPRFRGSGTVVGQNVLSVICAPVLDARGLFGVLYLDSSKREALFNADTKAFLDEFVEHLAPALRQRMAEEAKLRSMSLELRNTRARELGYRELIGTSAAMKRVLDDVEFANLHDDDLLFLGESGTGKELLARLAHDLSSLCAKNFVAFDCSSVPENLLSSALFGHTKGAFTDAKQQQAGVVAEAEGGTLFLDEIGNLSLSAQALLLRFLDNKVYRMLGTGHEKKAEVRLMFGTNSDLAEMVRQNAFREDLYYRLQKGVTIFVPPLRERGEDILQLADSFLSELNTRYHARVELGAEARACLLRYRHPGNVRHLEAILRGALRAVFKAGESIIQLHHLPAEVVNAAPSLALPESPPFEPSALYAKYLPAEFHDRQFIWGQAAHDDDTPRPVTLHERLFLDIKRALKLPLKLALRAVVYAFERNYLLGLLHQTEGKQNEAIKHAGVTKSAFIAKVRRHGIEITRNHFKKGAKP